MSASTQNPSSKSTPTPDLHYLKLLSEKFPTSRSAYTEIINLTAILDLPKATEHFMSDLHGEYEAFEHILNNCSGVIRERVRATFRHELTQSEQDDLCTLIYYPCERLKALSAEGQLNSETYYTLLLQLIRLARYLSSLYTRSKVRKSMPATYAYIIDELLRASAQGEKSRHDYHVNIIRSIIEVGSADDFICSIAALIKRLAVDHLHIVGDLFDRGPHPDKILDRLMEHHSLDIQWGNHDICWMGAAAGSDACIAAVVRNNIRYNAYNVLENAYGIPMRELALFAEKTYREEPELDPTFKAIATIQCKLEGQLISRRPEFNMQDRLLLNALDLAHGTVTIQGRSYQLTTTDFPTINPDSPYELSPEEARIMANLRQAFIHSSRLQRHISFMFEAGSLYKVSNGNLLVHGCIPLEPYGSFRTMPCDGKTVFGKAYLDFCDRICRRAWHEHTQVALDWMWYLWCGKYSPLSGRTMKTFERTFVADKNTWSEPEDPYFDLATSPDVCATILEEFDANPETGHIINGHTPVLAARGESPVKAEGKLVVIDGGFCSAYHAKTGIAGYTLISDADGMRIKAHEPFRGIQDALDHNADIESETDTITQLNPPLKVRDSDAGVHICQQISELKALLLAYREGLLPEHTN